MPVSGSSDLVNVSAKIKAKTDKALLLDDGDVSEWVPIAHVEDNKDGTFDMPEWLAIDKGFV